MSGSKVVLAVILPWFSSLVRLTEADVVELEQRLAEEFESPGRQEGQVQRDLQIIGGLGVVEHEAVYHRQRRQAQIDAGQEQRQQVFHADHAGFQRAAELPVRVLHAHRHHAGLFAAADDEIAVGAGAHLARVDRIDQRHLGLDVAQGHFAHQRHRQRCWSG